MFKFNIRIDINTKSLKIDNKKEFVEITCSYWKNVLKYYLSEKTLLKVLVVLSELLENALLYNTGDDIYFEILIYKENCVIITNNEIDTLKFNYIYEYIKEIKDDKFSFKYYLLGETWNSLILSGYNFTILSLVNFVCENSKKKRILRIERKSMSYPVFSHEYFMLEALKEARKALEKEEVPVGAVIIAANRIIARGYNQTESLNDVTAHAEMLAFTSAANTINSKYLNECILYVTLEPCIMCAGAAFWTQIGQIVYGAGDPKRGFSSLSPSPLHPSTIVIGGILENECSVLVKDFFKKKR